MLALCHVNQEEVRRRVEVLIDGAQTRLNLSIPVDQRQILANVVCKLPGSWKNLGEAELRHIVAQIDITNIKDEALAWTGSNAYLANFLAVFFLQLPKQDIEGNPKKAERLTRIYAVIARTTRRSLA